MKTFVRIFPSGNDEDVPTLFRELHARRVRHQWVFLPSGGFILAVPACEVGKLPVDRGVPWVPLGRAGGYGLSMTRADVGELEEQIRRAGWLPGFDKLAPDRAGGMR